MRKLWRLLLCFAGIVLISLPGAAQWRTPAREIHSADSIAQNERLNPEDLVKILNSKGIKPLILNVGPLMLFQQAHIPGAEFIGQGSDVNVLESLKKRVQTVPKAKSIILYCGCCPWTHCPNVEPALRRLQSLGFTNVKVLYLATNLGVDWVYKGYPTVRGQ